MALRPNTASCVYAVLALLWATDAVLLRGHLAICHRSLARVRHRAREFFAWTTVGELRMLSQRLGVPEPRLLRSDEVKSPLLTGFVRPAIILSESDASAPAGKLRAVLLHELAHLRRADCLANLLARVVCGVFFFQPLVWVLARRMEEASDEVADDIVLSAGVPATSYARDLTDWAERFLPSRREATAALGVIRFRSSLGRRVGRVLDGARKLATQLSWRGVADICLAAAVVCLAAGLVALHGGGGARGAEPAERPRKVEIRIQTIHGKSRTRTMVPSRHGDSWVRISERPWDSWLLWPYGGGSRLSFDLEAARVFVNQDGNRRLTGVLVERDAGIEAVCRELEAGAREFTVWCDGDCLDRLPPLPRSRDIALVCNVDGLSDLSPLAKQKGVTKLLLLGCWKVSDLTPLGGLTQLEYLGLVHCRRVSDLRPLAALTNLAALRLESCNRLSDLTPLTKLINLTELTLKGFRNAAGLAALAELPKLRSIDVNGVERRSDARAGKLAAPAHAP